MSFHNARVPILNPLTTVGSHNALHSRLWRHNYKVNSDWKTESMCEDRLLKKTIMECIYCQGRFVCALNRVWFGHSLASLLLDSGNWRQNNTPVRASTIPVMAVQSIYSTLFIYDELWDSEITQTILWLQSEPRMVYQPHQEMPYNPKIFYTCSRYFLCFGVTTVFMVLSRTLEQLNDWTVKELWRMWVNTS